MTLKRKILERDVELWLRDKAKLAGWSPYKFTSTSRRSCPDQLILGSAEKVSKIVFAHFGPILDPIGFAEEIMASCVTFVECKRPGETPTPAQEREHAKLRERGFTVLVVDNFKQIDGIYGGGK